MVASRKPKPPKKGERRPGESLEQMYQRVLEENMPHGNFEFSTQEARYVLQRLSERPRDPAAMTGDEVVKRFYGLWPEPAQGEYPD